MSIGAGPHIDAESDSDPDSDSSGFTSISDHRRGRRRKDREAESLLVRSTISRDTTKNTPAADLVDLSKLAALADDMPTNMIDQVMQELSPPSPSGVIISTTRPRRTRSLSPNIDLMPPRTQAPIPLPVYRSFAGLGFTESVHSTSILAKLKPGRDLGTLFTEI